MRMKVKDFCLMVDTNLAAFMTNLRAMGLTASTPDSYIETSKMLCKARKKNPAVADLDMIVEYQLPQAAAFCDVVLLGAGKTCPQVMVIELKDYKPNTTDRPGSYEGLMWHASPAGMIEDSHPSDQVKGYVEYCRNFHSAVVDASGTKKADVCGCVFFTKKGFNDAPYALAPNDQLVLAYPTYTLANSDALADFIANTFTGDDSAFSTAFESGSFVQNRNIMKQVASNLRAAATTGYRPFVLLDNQRKGLQQTMGALALACANNQKSVIIVEGPPGSGKSAVAINLLLETIGNYAGKGNIFFVTTSASQHHNWAHVFTSAGKLRKGWGIQKIAASFKPQGINSVNVLQPVFPSYYDAVKNTMDPLHYEDYVNYAMTLPQKEYGDNVDFLTITDEAHALINPLSPLYTGHKQGFANYTGPEAYHIIRRSKVSVFFTDPNQSFRDFESTSIQDIENIGLHLGATIIHVDLGKMQFRCAGSVDYIKWVDGLFTPTPVKNHPTWDKLFDVQVFKSPSDMEAQLRRKGTSSIRLLSSYSREWVSEKKLKKMHTPGVPYDFDLLDSRGGHWKNYWNNPEGYEIFVQAVKGSSMETDPLCEVGCAYVVRGFDFDYVGVLMLDDVVWRTDKWMIKMGNCHETATKSRRKMAKEELKKMLVAKGYKKGVAQGFVENGEFPADDPSIPYTQYLFKTIKQAYRILMTRGIKGMYLCIPDDETRKYIQSLL